MICRHCDRPIEWRRHPSVGRSAKFWRTDDLERSAVCAASGGSRHRPDLSPAAVRRALA